MNYRKIETPENFRYLEPDGSGGLRVGGEAVTPRLEAMGRDTWLFSAASARWGEAGPPLSGLEAPGLTGLASEARCTISEGGCPRLELGGVELLAPAPGRGLGLCGSKWILAFRFDAEARFHGLGGKNLGLEVSGRKTRFWNTDLFADFDWGAVEAARADPLYASLPVLYVERGGLWAALVVESPAAPFIDAGAVEGIFAAGSTPFERGLSLGALSGPPRVWILASGDPLELVRRTQSLQGRVPPPPLWALGHHQSRWGYRDFAAVEGVAREYERRRIPNDGLWLDIDAMEGFRVFTTDPERYAKPEERLSDFASRGFKVVPILDPGIRRDPDFPVYAEAKRRGILCRTPEGGDYVGFVWPGYTVFPDFSLPEGRAFWAAQVESFARRGFAGFWIDMNDPSTGTAPLDDMRFSRGALPHAEFHNLYALGMAMATRAGLEAARPGERPFVLSRSGSLGLAPYAAVWTGDSVSNRAHLAASIAISLNLSVSGLPFCGPDVPGFSGDADAQLMRAWYKVSFLFPFLRNHCAAGSRDQEPWTRGRRTERVVRGLLETRYRLLPYLYGLFLDQAEAGDPILRPLWLVDPRPAAAAVADEFLVGPSILQAPLLDEGRRSREVLLPEGSWYEVRKDRLVEGGEKVEASESCADTPLWLRSPSVLPLAGEPALRADRTELSRADFLLVLAEGQGLEHRYRFDDGRRADWRTCPRSEYLIRAGLSAGRLEVEVEELRAEAGTLRFRILLPRAVAKFARELRVNGAPVKTRAEGLPFAGSRLLVRATAPRRV